MPSSVLRENRTDRAPEVTRIELFFDLVYVFAVTQLAHRLAEHLTARGALETLVLFLAVWWAWNYTAWAMNWADPERTPVRALLVALMLLSLLMSAAIPQAFTDRAVPFAVAYVALQSLRSAFMVWALRGERMGRNYAQLLAWTLIAAVPWIAGAFAHGDLRLALWILALLLDYGAPVHGFALPRLGSTPIGDWTLAGGHLAERCQLVLLIALGESILAVGVTFSDEPWSAANVAAFAVGFTGTVALWWLYFSRQAASGATAIAQAGEAARLGRAGYAYAHAVMVAGVIVVAVGFEQTVAHPTGSTSAAVACAILGGPALFYAGNGVFKFALTRRIPVSRLVALAALALLEPLAIVASPLALSAAATVVTAALAAWPGPPSAVLGDGSPGQREGDADRAGGEQGRDDASAQGE
jgi:low temperature requirement protein LtrA